MTKGGKKSSFLNNTKVDQNKSRDKGIFPPFWRVKGGFKQNMGIRGGHIFIKIMILSFVEWKKKKKVLNSYFK